MEDKIYIAIDLKSFYASVECVERGLDPLVTNLVVADPSRTEKTICLAVSPSLKEYGIPGRPRLFEVVQKIKQVNKYREYNAPEHKLSGESYDAAQLKSSPSLAISYIVAEPRMAYYMKYSTDIYKIYLKYVAPEDIFAYSIDEVFIDATNYLETYKLTPEEFTIMLVHDVLSTTGITATAGIGSNLYLCKIAMDIVAKHIPPDKNGVRIARLDEMSYRRSLWAHTPLTDFWRVGHGYAEKLEKVGLYTMGDIARCSLGGPQDYYNEELLYKLFGVNAELLIDHAWGWEPCTMKQIKEYKPEFNSISSGQVLQSPYEFDKARLIVWEMADMLALDLVEKNLTTNQLVLTIGYDAENLKNHKTRGKYSGGVSTDYYGRNIPKHAHGTANLPRYTSSSKLITQGVIALYDRIVDKDLTIRRINISANKVMAEGEAVNACGQLDMFSDEVEDKALLREKNVQQAMLRIKKRYGNNAVLKGANFKEGSTAISRNGQIGGHKA